MIRFILCWLRCHGPRRFYCWDMVGDPRIDGWYEFTCPKCGRWKDE